MSEFIRPQVQVEEINETSARVSVEPLERGYGDTLGNSLRRVLLSSLEGAAVEAIQIDGAQHEFMTIPNMVEDVTDIVLNVKGLVFRALGTTDEATATISVDGPCEVTGADFFIPSEFAGETQADVLMETYLTIPAGVLIATGLVKAMLTPALINLGWRGGHFFPVIFSGVSLGYGLAILTGADPVFCVAVCTASTMGAVMRQPVMVVGLLLMCFPLKGIVCMIIAAVIAAGIPLPKSLRK